MLFSWLERRRRERIRATPFAATWLDYLRKNAAVYDLLPAADQARLRDDLRIFIAEKTWEGCGGQAVTEEVKVTVAAQACLLLLGVEHDYFGHVQTILVYPSAYKAPEGVIGPAGVVHEGVGRLGEAWRRGPVILGWNAVCVGGQHPEDGSNLVLHEFAHQLDFLDGLADGTPPLRNREQYQRWQGVMKVEYDRLRNESDRGQATVLDQYGATDPAEFFAVATECFFEKPVQLERRHPHLYDVLRDCYCQDPVSWFSPSEAPASPLRGRRPYRATRNRKSRQVAELDPAVDATHPRWVRFWMLGTYWPRNFAVGQLWYMLCLLAVCLIVGGLALGGVEWPAFGSAIVMIVLANVIGVSAIWLWLAIKWVDRNGWKPAGPDETPQQTPPHDSSP